MKLVCIKCPKGCELQINGDSITGNACPRGIDYAKEELTAPKRTVTSLCKTECGVVSIKTTIEVPKEMIFDILKVISNIKVKKCKIGDIILKNILNTGADIVVTGCAYL